MLSPNNNKNIFIFTLFIEIFIYALFTRTLMSTQRPFTGRQMQLGNCGKTTRRKISNKTKTKWNNTVGDSITLTDVFAPVPLSSLVLICLYEIT